MSDKATIVMYALLVCWIVSPVALLSLSAYLLHRDRDQRGGRS